MSAFEAAVTEVIAGLEPGEVVSYGEVAAMAGYPGRARGVGTILAGSEGLPWWRVVASDGRLRAPDAALQTTRLEEEGVTIIDGRVRLPRRTPDP